MSGIYKAITEAMKEISPIAKGKKNAEQHFQYRGIDDVMNELNPILTKHNIFIYPEVIESKRSERQTQRGGTLLYSILTIRYHFAAEDGSEICATVIGEGMDSGDKASNKAMAIAFKYACLQTFCIPTVDMPDPDASTPEQTTPKAKTTPPAQKPTSPKNGKPPIPPQDELTCLKNEAWKLIQRLPQEKQADWINSCEGANEATLREIIRDLTKLLAVQPQDDLVQLRRNTWELIKKLPTDDQVKWINQCNGADGQTLKKIYVEVNAILNAPQMPPAKPATPAAPQEKQNEGQRLAEQAANSETAPEPQQPPSAVPPQGTTANQPVNEQELEIY